MGAAASLIGGAGRQLLPMPASYPIEAMADDRPPPKAPDSERASRHVWEVEGGSVDQRVPGDNRYADRVVSGRIVQKGGSGQPYTVVLTHEDGHTSEHPCATMREGEAFIRRAAPAPPKRDSSRDRKPGQA
jgi:hypothetical protein